MVMTAMLLATEEVTVAEPIEPDYFLLEGESIFRFVPRPELSWVNLDESWSCFPLKRIEVMSPFVVCTFDLHVNDQMCRDQRMATY